ncbi:OLC1v1014747C1 [Oldenlandia corymbosa var. corymbosa]|uniref:OLC1v1014747C1 n=1 Tax=Oldenlandia corymbosa var. corymbosa TaxID=529605 RepID=A0AAV1E3V0_OLDCO|nr:OLC1v1014747C1 [Oldenlandia corymbosa var. corymbosa]
MPSKTSASRSGVTPTQSYYHPIPTEPETQYVIVLPRYYNPIRWRRGLIWLGSLLLIAAIVFLLWPSDPEVSVVRLRLEHLRVHTFPTLNLDITLDTTVKVRNRDFYSIDFNSLIVAIGYRGKQLGYVTSDHGHIKARGSSYINATLELKGVEIFSDVLPLIEDLAKGEITFDTVSRIGGQFGLFLFEFPLKGKVSCEIIVNTRNQTIEHQNCYPE